MAVYELHFHKNNPYFTHYSILHIQCFNSVHSDTTKMHHTFELCHSL